MHTPTRPKQRRFRAAIRTFLMNVQCVSERVLAIVIRSRSHEILGLQRAGSAGKNPGLPQAAILKSLFVSELLGRAWLSESAGINRRGVGDERAPQ